MKIDLYVCMITVDNLFLVRLPFSSDSFKLSVHSWPFAGFIYDVGAYLPGGR